MIHNSRKSQTYQSLLLKSIYFSTSVIYYILHLFRSIFLIEIFNVEQKNLGICLGILFFIAFVTNILIAMATDKFKVHKEILITSLICSFISFQILLFNPEKSSKDLFHWTILTFYLTFNSSLIPILDKFVLESYSSSYGKFRIFDAFGYIFSSFTTEIFFKKGRGFLYLRIFNAIFSALCTILCVFTLKNPKSLKKESQIKPNSKFSSFCNLKCIIFFLIILLNGITRSQMTNYLSLFYKYVLKLKPYKSKLYFPIDFLNSNPISACSLTGIIGEVLVFYFREEILLIRGTYFPILIGIFLQLARLILYRFIDWNSRNVFIFALLIELLKGLGFGMIHISASKLAFEMFPKKFKAISQVIYNGTYMALGSLFSGLVSLKIFNDIKTSEDFVKFYNWNIYITLLSILLFFKIA